MKIAIMTQPLGKNYGGIMQAWALQQVLKRMGHEVVTIDRQPDKKGALHTFARLGYRVAMRVIGKRRAPVNFEKYLPAILQHTQRFIDQNMTMSEPLDSTVKLKAHFDYGQYDVVIVGSDQTWRPIYSPNIENFFLDFLDDQCINRIAYATSFGVDSWEFSEEQTGRCKVLAKSFNAISVREDSGIALCRANLAVEATHVLDPTLLLDKEDYIQLIGTKRIKNKPEGVYTYFLDKTTEKQSLAKKVGRELRENIYSCQAKYGLDPSCSSIVDEYIMPDVVDWLAGFYNARFILTDSFHGMVFSIIFGKPFLVVNNKERGGGRFLSLVKMLDQENIIVDDDLSIDISLLSHIENRSKKDYRGLLDKYELSLEFLNKAIQYKGFK